MKKVFGLLVLALLLTSCTSESYFEPIPVSQNMRTIHIKRASVPFQVTVNTKLLSFESLYSENIYSATFQVKKGTRLWFGGGIPDLAKINAGYFIVTNNGVEVFRGMDDNGPDGAPIGIVYIVE